MTCLLPSFVSVCVVSPIWQDEACSGRHAQSLSDLPPDTLKSDRSKLVLALRAPYAELAFLPTEARLVGVRGFVRTCARDLARVLDGCLIG